MDWATGWNTGVSGLRRMGRTVGWTGRIPSYWAEYMIGRTSGRSKVQNSGRGGLGRTGANGADWGTGRRSGRSGLRNPRRGGLG